MIGRVLDIARKIDTVETLRNPPERLARGGKLAAMRFSLISLLFIAGCGGSDTDAHAVGACEGWLDNQGNPYTGMCEAACKTPPTSTGMVCDTVARLGCAAFSFDGTDGCCIEESATIKFYECQ